MPPGHAPGPTGDAHHNTVKIDSGTLARTKSPKPGPIGLPVTQLAAKTTAASPGPQIVAFAQANLGQTVGDGQCFA
ncbi:MAG: hypothetical protein P8Y71_29985, partial [Pseudolabrys sp.]